MDEEMTPMQEFALLMRIEAGEADTFDALAAEDGWAYIPGVCTCGNHFGHAPRCGWLWEEDTA